MQEKVTFSYDGLGLKNIIYISPVVLLNAQNDGNFDMALKHNQLQKIMIGWKNVNEQYH